MSDYAAMLDNIIQKPMQRDTFYQRIFMVSAYSDVTKYGRCL